MSIDIPGFLDMRGVSYSFPAYPRVVDQVDWQIARGEVHSLVYRVVLSPKDGALQVWLNGDAVLDARGISIGSSDAQCYWSFGCYYSGGVTCPIIAEYGDHIYPGPTDLRRRIGIRPDWSRAA